MSERDTTAVMPNPEEDLLLRLGGGFRITVQENEHSASGDGLSYVSAPDFLGDLRPVTPVGALTLFLCQLQGWNETMAPKLPPDSWIRDVRKPDGVGRIDLCDTRAPLQNENVGLRVQNLLRISRK